MTLFEITHSELLTLQDKYKPLEDGQYPVPTYSFLQVEQSIPVGQPIEDFKYVFLVDDSVKFKKDVGNSKLKVKTDTGKTEGYFHNIPQDGATWEEILISREAVIADSRTNIGDE